MVAVKRIHEKDIVHLDFKPENIVFTKTDKGIRKLKVIDFGISMKMQEEPIRLITCNGTEAYMPPEALIGKYELDPKD